MNRVVYKYELAGDAIRIPKGKVLLVAQQDHIEVPTVWVEHPLDNKGVLDWDNTMTLIKIATGQQFQLWAHAHVGSCICGPYVWHIYGEL